MTMTLDQQSNGHLGGLSFDHLPPAAGPGPNLQFNNPWSSSTTSGSMYQPMPTHVPATHNMGFDAIAKQAQRNSTHAPLPYQSSSVPTSAPLGASTGYASQYGGSDLVGMSQDLLNNAQTFSSGAPQSVGSYAPASMSYNAPFGSVGPPPPQDSRRMSTASSQPSYSDALDASRGMVALSHGADLTTPRGLYDTRNDQVSQDGYGFPIAHSSHSSVSGASSSYGGSYGYAESVGSSSMSDYGSQSDLESVNSRTLPRPSALGVSATSLAPTAAANSAAAAAVAANTASGLPAPQSMMGQFNSKISSSTQKKHKCKVCDKRFTRPSSLQTHMYSHTGEKPYACDEKGCGRHFSVVSNLRRHRKVHKTEGGNGESSVGGSERDHGSPEGSWASLEK